jgi:hypothetical protein
MTEENTFELTGDQSLIQSSKNFALIIDGEVAGNYTVPVFLGTEKIIAIFQSNPTIVETEDKIAEGSTWDGQTFTPPVE